MSNFFTDLDYVANKVSQIDAVINGLKESTPEVLKTHIEHLYDIQQAMEDEIKTMRSKAEEIAENETDALWDILEDDTETKYISDVEDIFTKHCKSFRFVDEKIDDGLEDCEDEYLMKKCYEVHLTFGKYYVNFYYGNNTQEITYFDTERVDIY